MDPDLLRAAACDYLYLLDRGYPERPAVALVGDRFILSKDERLVLYRGVCAREVARKRAAKAWRPAATLDSAAAARPDLVVKPPLLVDGYNVFFTVLNQRLGRAIFLALDGYIRDAGASHGRVADGHLFEEVMADVFGHLSRHGFHRVDVILDRPVSHSGIHAVLARQRLSASGLAGDCNVEDSADYRLKRFGPGLVASSDSAVIDAVDGEATQVFDLAHHFLESTGRTRFLNLRELLGEDPGERRADDRFAVI